ncbi:O-antigen ligase family protein [Enterococcus raffinosus]|uniref:O-antigen ligase family protein n=1 Tax=Enterococcus raffinosus TaxID=71452 RepID=A0AAW8T9Y1_9ENTE|nr:O-antigen ligase family protein [Enterococcus raffinosus]MDT2522028.1 O-antigen ligase family protein [Enterococcus raffinosus]MDT2528372.1 O-antigen ligase family protein [Enterococcus raffinosus]MDT2533162.1 O-antigen ligase family protein [Enterococcus raffinosus]MDT2543602.1 O-antigen ligase family protein [Enterococcus raffinosus]MDT2553716.1 O-antigen ligase family protein [Enterococcus raffinosus]
MIFQTEDFSYKIFYMYVVSLLALQIANSLQFLQSTLLYGFIFFSGLFIVKKGWAELNYYFISYGSFFLYCAVQSLFIKNSRTLGFLYDLFTCLVIVFLVINIIGSKRQIEKIMYGIVVGAVLFATIVFYYYEFSFARMVQETAAGLRIGHKLTNPNFIGITCSYGTCIAVFLIFENIERKNYRLVLLLMVSAIFSGYFSFISGSRMTYLTLFVGIVFVFFFEFLPRMTFKRTVLLLFLTSITLGLFFHLEAFSWSRHRLMQMFLMMNGEGSSEGSINERKQLLEAGLRLFSKHPFLGNGVDALREQAGYNAHNNYVEILSNNGVIGFLLYYLGYFFQCILLVRVREKDRLYTIMLFTMISLLVNEIAQITYYDRFTQIKLALISCYLVLEFQKKRRKRDYV